MDFLSAEEKTMSRDYQFIPDRLDLENKTAEISGAEHAHLKKVLRLKPGNTIIVSDGRGTLYEAEIRKITKDFTRAELRDRIKTVLEPALKITLIQALPKNRKMAWILQKGTELGVCEFVPVMAENCVSRIEDKAWKSKKERWNAIIRGAVKQSHRVNIPRLQDLTSLSQALTSAKSRVKLLCDTKARLSLKACLARTGPLKEIVVAIGPEGGFSPDERTLALQEGFTSCSLGPRVLRLETATVKILSVLQFLYGDTE